MANGSADPSFKFYHHHLWKYKYQMPKADYIIVDEIQDFTKEEINMFSLVIIGNSQTYVQEGWMVTPRGYEKKEQL